MPIDNPTEPTLAFLLSQLTTRAKVLYIPTLLASDLAAGGGFILVTGGTGSSGSMFRAFLRCRVNSNIGDVTFYRVMEPSLLAGYYRGINWNKELYFQFSLLRWAVGTGSNEIEGYVQMKGVTTKGAFTGKGIGIRIKGTDGLDIRGESYNTEEGTADFDANLTHGSSIVVGIHHRPGVSVDFYVNGTLQANNITDAAQVPTGTNLTANELVVSLETTDDPNADITLNVGGFLIIQAF